MLTLELHNSWSDPHYCGLAGLQVLGANGQPLKLPKSAFSALPADLNSVPGHSGDLRVVGNLATPPDPESENAYNESNSMWLAPSAEWISQCDPNVEFIIAAKLADLTRAAEQAGQKAKGPRPICNPLPNLLQVNLGATPVLVSGVMVHNYNKSNEDSYRGVKLMRIRLDGVEVTPPGGVLVFKAPGEARVEFG